MAAAKINRTDWQIVLLPRSCGCRLYLKLKFSHPCEMHGSAIFYVPQKDLSLSERSRLLIAVEMCLGAEFSPGRPQGLELRSTNLDVGRRSVPHCYHTLNPEP